MQNLICAIFHIVDRTLGNRSGGQLLRLRSMIVFSDRGERLGFMWMAFGSGQCTWTQYALVHICSECAYGDLANALIVHLVMHLDILSDLLQIEGEPTSRQKPIRCSSPLEAIFERPTQYCS
jgi:hypothetical protein